MKKLKRRRKRKERISYDIESEFWGVKILEKATLKIVLVLLVIGLNWMGVSSIDKTIAYFSDIEQSLGNIYGAGTLDFSLFAPGDFSLNLTAASTAVRNIHILNEGNLNFQYIIEAGDFQGDLCENLNVEAKLNGTKKYEGSLTEFSLFPSALFSHPENWQFKFTFSGDPEEYNKETCQFYFNFMGWQDNMESYLLSGFDDIEKSLTRITLHLDKNVVLNEILADPFGDDCSLEGIEGEWVELYNNSETARDVNGWYIENSAGSKVKISNSNTMSGSTVIPPKGWLVVFLNGCILNNDGDSVKFYHSAGIELVDHYTYFEPKPEGSSFARIPDGIGAWFDPVPTPGAPNRLEIIEKPEPEEEKPEEKIFELNSILPEPDLLDLILPTTTPSDLEIVEPVLPTATPQEEEIFEIKPDIPDPIIPNIPEPITETTTSSKEETLPMPEPEPIPVLEIIPDSIMQTVTPSDNKIVLNENNNDENDEKENE